MNLIAHVDAFMRKLTQKRLIVFYREPLKHAILDVILRLYYRLSGLKVYHGPRTICR